MPDAPAVLIPTSSTSTTSTIGTSTTSTTTTSTGPILHYSFDVDEGGIVSDQSGNGHTGTVFGATWTAEGVIGGSCRFDGNNDYINVPNVNDNDQRIKLDASVISVSAWVKLENSGGWLDMLSKHSLPDDTGWVVYRRADNRFWFEAGNGVWPSLQIFTANVYTQGWYHVVAVNSETQAMIFVDGQIQAVGSGTIIKPNNLSLYLGRNRDNGGNYFDGLMDDVRIYNRVLSNSEIQTLYGLGSTTSTTSTTSSTATSTSSTTIAAPVIIAVIDRTQLLAIYLPGGTVAPYYATNLSTMPVEWTPVQTFTDNEIVTDVHLIEMLTPGSPSMMYYMLLQTFE